MKSIAIDGPAAAGKTTLAKALARALGFTYVDTGALYRAIALHALELKKELGREVPVHEVLNTADIEIQRDENGEQRVFLRAVVFRNGCLGFLAHKDVTDDIRTEEISKLASDLSALPEVRAHLLAKQRAIAQADNVVMEGRDIGTVILPNATLKVYLTAREMVRAKRRLDDLLAKGVKTDFETVRNDLALRDYNDLNRAEAPLRQAEDAVLVDDSELTITETTEKILKICKELETPLVRTVPRVSACGYGFTLTATKDIPCKTAPSAGDTLRWTRWDSDDGRFAVCCEDDVKHHHVTIFPQGVFPYRPEVYTRNNDDTGDTEYIVMRPGHDKGGLTSLTQIDAYLREMSENRRAVEAIQYLFLDHWKDTKMKMMKEDY